MSARLRRKPFGYFCPTPQKGKNRGFRRVQGDGLVLKVERHELNQIGSTG
jgi:hypothetical protein